MKVMKLKAKVMQILVADLQPNLIGAFYIMSSGIEMPDTVTKTDLTNIISFLCKKLDWIEELNETTSAKPSEEKYEKSMSHDHNNSFDSEIINKDQSPSMKDWIEDGLSGPIEENSEEEVDSFHNSLPPVTHLTCLSLDKSFYWECEHTWDTGHTTPPIDPSVTRGKI